MVYTLLRYETVLKFEDLPLKLFEAALKLLSLGELFSPQALPQSMHTPSILSGEAT